MTKDNDNVAKGTQRHSTLVENPCFSNSKMENVVVLDSRGHQEATLHDVTDFLTEARCTCCLKGHTYNNV